MFPVKRYGLFSQTSTSDRLLIPNTAARFLDNGIQRIEFLGRVVGKALYEGILLDYLFSHVFVQKLLGRYSFLDELSTLDPELYRNLMYVKVKFLLNPCYVLRHYMIGEQQSSYHVVPNAGLYVWEVPLLAK